MKTLIPFLAFCLIATCNAEPRTWTAVNGKEVEAEFVSNSDGQVSLKMKTGKIFKVLLNKLSKADQDFITAMSSSIPQKEKPKTGKYIPPEGALNDDPAAGQLDLRGRLYYKKGSDTPYSGIIYLLYENGQPVFESVIKDGKSHGLYVEWYKNGQKKQELNNKDGKQNGLHVMWYENGQKAREANFKDGKYDGLWVAWHNNGKKGAEKIFKDGKLISEKYWDDKGEPVESERQALGTEEKKQVSDQITKTLLMASYVCKALHKYALDFDLRFPEKLENLVPNYLNDKSYFSMTCEDGSRKPMNYVKWLTTKSENDKVILYSPEPIEGKWFVAFVDGSARAMEEGEFRALVKDSKKKLKHSEVDALLRKRNGNKKDNLEIVKQYLSNGGSINQRNKFGGTLLHVASANGNKEIVQLLLSKEAEVNVKNNGGLTPLGLALKFKRSEVSELLHEYGAKTGEEIKPTQISNELLSAVKKGNEKAVKKQLDDDVDVTAMDETGATVLHYAAIGGRDVIIKILLKAGADVNAKMKNNNTPLHMAIFGGAKKDALLALLEGGANVNAQTWLKWTPLDAVEYGRSRSSSWRDETIELLRKRGGKTKEELRDKKSSP